MSLSPLWLIHRLDIAIVSTINTRLSTLEASCTLLPLIMKQLDAIAPPLTSPLPPGLPQPQQFLSPQASNCGPQVGGTNSVPLTGFSPVPQRIPLSGPVTSTLTSCNLGVTQHTSPPTSTCICLSTNLISSPLMYPLVIQIPCQNLNLLLHWLL